MSACTSRSQAPGVCKQGQRLVHTSTRSNWLPGRCRRAARMPQAAAQSAAFTAEPAAGLAAPPPARQEAVFYTHTLCPYAERVWIALLEKGAPFHLVHIDLSRKPAWFRSVNPRGLVPALQHGGQVHLESADICRYVDASFQGPALVPADAARRKEMETLLRGPCSGVVSAGLDLMAGRGRHWGIGSGQSAAQKAAFESELAALAGSLNKHGGPFLLGPEPSLADVDVYPFLQRFAVGMPALCGYDPHAALGGAIGAWLDAMSARPSCRVTAADPALLLAAFRKHKSLDFFDYDAYSIFELHPQNAGLLAGRP